jgi:hypothetical protein
MGVMNGTYEHPDPIRKRVHTLQCALLLKPINSATSADQILMSGIDAGHKLAHQPQSPLVPGSILAQFEGIKRCAEAHRRRPPIWISVSSFWAWRR